MCFGRIATGQTRRLPFGKGVDVDLESDPEESANFELRELERIGRGVHAREEGRNIIRLWFAAWRARRE